MWHWNPLHLTWHLDMKLDVWWWSVFQAQYQRWKNGLLSEGRSSRFASLWLYERSPAVRMVEIRLIPQAVHLGYTVSAWNSNSIIVTISARQGSWGWPCFLGSCLFKMHIYLSSLAKCLSYQALCDPELSGVRRAARCFAVRVNESAFWFILLYPPCQRRMLFSLTLAEREANLL